MKSKILHNAVCIGNEKILENHISTYGINGIKQFANNEFRYIDYLLICGHFNLIKHNISYEDESLKKIISHIVRGVVS